MPNKNVSKMKLFLMTAIKPKRTFLNTKLKQLKNGLNFIWQYKSTKKLIFFQIPPNAAIKHNKNQNMLPPLGGVMSEKHEHSKWPNIKQRIKIAATTMKIN